MQLNTPEKIEDEDFTDLLALKKLNLINLILCLRGSDLCRQYFSSLLYGGNKLRDWWLTQMVKNYVSYQI